MKIALLGTGSGQVHAAVYSQRPDVDEVVVFGRTPEKLAEFGEQFGLATTTDPDALVADPTVDLVDICLPTRLHAEVAVQAMRAGRDVLIELPLAPTIADARRIVAAQRATGRRAFVDMFSRFTHAHQQLRHVVGDRRYGPLQGANGKALSPELDTHQGPEEDFPGVSRAGSDCAGGYATRRGWS